MAFFEDLKSLFFLGKFAVETKGKTFRQIEAEFALMNGVEQNDDEEKVKLNPSTKNLREN